jgi:transposase
MIISDQLGEPMKKRTRPTFSTEFRLEASQLVVDQNYTVLAAAKGMNVGISTMAKWVTQLKQERQGKPYTAATPMTPDQPKIRELEKRIGRIELEKEIFKKRLRWYQGGQCNMVFNHSSRC